MADGSLSPRPAARPSSDIRRRHHRVSLIWSGQLAAGEASLSCAILNLSNGGAMLRCPDDTHWPSHGDGTPVELESARFGRVKGRVIWRKGRALGLAFQDAQRTISEGLAGGGAPRLAPILAG